MMAMRGFVLTVLLVCVAASAAGRVRGTRRVRAAEVTAAAVTAADVDTVMSPEVRLSGYDKPAGASREAVHVANSSGRHLLSVTLLIRYLDMQGRELHNARVEVPCDIADGDTGLVTWPSWDCQNSFYYARGRAPRRQATPYTVAMSVVSATAGPVAAVSEPE